MDEDEAISPDQEIDFCTLGMFIIGKKRFPFTKLVNTLVTVFSLSA